MKELKNIVFEWLKRKLRSPFSNAVTKITLYCGIGLVASPIIEHLIFSAILKHWLGIDLGIEVPDLNAYIFGSLLIFIASIHNLIFIKLNQEYSIKIKDAKSSIYKDLWTKCDKMIDDAFRLEPLYMTDYSPKDTEYVLAAEQSSMEFMEFLRVNRPFIFSEDFYSAGADLYQSCIWQIRCFWGCLEKKEENHVKGETNYDFHLAQKQTSQDMGRMKSNYEGICQEIRQFVDEI